MEVKRILDLKDSSGEFLLDSENVDSIMKEAVYYLDKKTNDLTDEQFMEWLIDKMNNGSFNFEDKMKLESDLWSPEFAFLTKKVLKIGAYISMLIDNLVEANGLSSSMPEHLNSEI